MLTLTTIRQLKPKAKAYRVADLDGLYLEVRPTGKKYWRYRFKLNQKEQMLSLGMWGDVGLQDARDLARDARRLVLDGVHPLDQRRERRAQAEQSQSSLFPEVAKAWLAMKAERVGSDTLRKADTIIHNDFIPALRRVGLQDLKTPQVVRILTSIHERAPSLAKKARQYINEIIAFAVQQGYREDGRPLSLQGALPSKQGGHLPAAIDPETLGKVLRAIDVYPSDTTRTALQLASLTAMRPGIIATAQWAHINLEAGTWAVPGELMKMNRRHAVPLPKQALELLGSLPRWKHCPWVFRSPARQKTPHLSRDALSKALREMGFQGVHVTHGFRATLRTMGREELNIDIDVLETQLAHAKKNAVDAAYDRARFEARRRDVMQRWADYLDEVRCNDADQ